MSEAGVANTVYNVQDKEKPMAVRNANILAARGLNYQCLCSFGSFADENAAVADAIRTVIYIFWANKRKG
jgi:hypothetical protein